MKNKVSHTPNTRNQKSWLLVALQLVLSFGAIGGGAGLVIDPQGGSLNMPVSLLESSPFSDYLIPGLILMVFLGFGPMVIAVCLIKRPRWRLGEKLNVFKDRHWSWAFTLYTGFALIIWITAQMYMLQMAAIIHMVYMLLALAIQVAVLLPGVQRKYAV